MVSSLINAYLLTPLTKLFVIDEFQTSQVGSPCLLLDETKSRAMFVFVKED